MAKKGSAILKAITTRAKQMRKKQPGMSWLSAVKKAGAEYRSGKKPAAKKKASRIRKTAGSKITHTRTRRKVSGIRTNADKVDRKRVNVTIGSVSHHKSMAKKGIRHQIENAAGRRELTIKLRERKKLTRTIAKLKKDYRALC
jgi:hypothetical protein